MIVDCHTHLWDQKKHLGSEFLGDWCRVIQKPVEKYSALPEEHLKAIEGVDKAVVLAFRSRALGVNVPNEYVAEYVDKHPDRLIGFCCVDPNDDDAPRELKRCVRDLHMQGLKLGPIYQHFDPNSEKADGVFRTCEELGIPILIHQGTTFVRDAPLKYALPHLLDEVATKHRDLRMIVAHLGHPWEDETVALIRKQPNVYSDVSALLMRPLRLYLDLLTCVEYGVTDKLVLGSDFPAASSMATIRGLRAINKYARRTRMPNVPKTVIEDIIQRNWSRAFGDL